MSILISLFFFVDGITSFLHKPSKIQRTEKDYSNFIATPPDSSFGDVSKSHQAASSFQTQTPSVFSGVKSSPIPPSLANWSKSGYPLSLLKCFLGHS